MNTKTLKVEFQQLFAALSKKEKDSNFLLRRKMDQLKIKLLMLQALISMPKPEVCEEDNGN